jgi:DNA-binding transcriptional LysR family regulator
MTQNINWDNLRIFLIAARKENIADAAKDLKLDETTVSRRLRRLEDDLGQILFEKHRRGYRLSGAGQILLEKCEEIELSAGAIFENNGENDRNIKGTIRLSAAEGFGAKVLTKIIAKFHQLHPEVEIDLISGSGFLSLSRREADIAIGLSKPKSKLIISKPLVDYELGLYVGENYNRKIIDFDDLKNHTLISYIDDLIYAPELRYFEEIFPYLKPSLRCSSIIAKMALVESGIGIAILPDFMAKNKLKRIFTDKINIQRTFYLSSHKSIIDTKRHRIFQKFLYDNMQNSF